MMKETTQKSYPLFLTPNQASKLSGLGVNRIRELMNNGQLEYLPVGNRKLLRLESLLDYYQRAKIPVE